MECKQLAAARHAAESELITVRSDATGNRLEAQLQVRWHKCGRTV